MQTIDAFHRDNFEARIDATGVYPGAKLGPKYRSIYIARSNFLKIVPLQDPDSPKDTLFAGELILMGPDEKLPKSFRLDMDLFIGSGKALTVRKIYLVKGDKIEGRKKSLLNTLRSKKLLNSIEDYIMKENRGIAINHLSVKEKSELIRCSDKVDDLSNYMVNETLQSKSTAQFIVGMTLMGISINEHELKCNINLAYVEDLVKEEFEYIMSNEELDGKISELARVFKDKILKGDKN
jgi:hypothetical protein